MLIARVATALVFGAVLIGALFFLPAVAAAGVFALLWLAGAWEWGGLARLSPAGRVAYVLVLAAAMAGARYAFASAAASSALLAIAALWWLGVLASLLVYREPISSPLAAATGVLVLVPGWYALAYVLERGPRGGLLVVLALAIVWAADVGAFFAGRWFGRTKLAPAVSPGKTWEGVAGGAILAAIAGLAGAHWLGLSAAMLAVLALASALVSVVGDLSVSRLKRNVGVKDSGHWLPGHGGVLDRIDSLTAALPAYALGLKLAGLVP